MDQEKHRVDNKMKASSKSAARPEKKQKACLKSLDFHLKLVREHLVLMYRSGLELLLVVVVCVGILTNTFWHGSIWACKGT